MIMRKHSNNAIWLTTLFLLLIVTNGCSDPDKNGKARSNSAYGHFRGPYWRERGMSEHHCYGHFQ